MRRGQAKPPKPRKDADARRREARLIRTQLQDLGIPDQDLEPVGAALDEFVDRAEGVTRTFKLPHLGVAVLLQLSMQPHVVSFARVRRV